jgi:hypothetical protein
MAGRVSAWGIGAILAAVAAGSMAVPGSVAVIAQADETVVPSIHGAAAVDDEAVARRVDLQLQAAWESAGFEPAPPASDAEFMRRAYLDLTGRIPRIAEAREFLADPRPDKRARLIDSLLARPAHASHLANTWRSFLLPENFAPNQFAATQGFDGWLRGRFANNAPYDELVREIILARGQVNQAGPVYFYTSLQNKPEELAASTSRAFLGVKIECAQCHDHPFDHWTQEDFWGFAAFFARLSRSQGQPAAFQVLDGNEGEVTNPRTGETVPPRYLRGNVVADEEGVTRRQKLAEWLTWQKNPYFARAAVNRAWALLFGRGIVDPVDDLGEHNVASHPEVLDELSRHFIETGFDLRRLLRTLALTRAYQLSSRASADRQAPPGLFARMAVKTLTGEQLYDCLGVASARREAGAQQALIGFNASYNAARVQFLTRFRTPAGSTAEYLGGIPQALTLMNGELVAAATDLERSDLLIALQAPFFSDEERVESLFLATLSRLPDDSERARFVEYVASRPSAEERQAALADIFWALLNSAEFTFNH